MSSLSCLIVLLIASCVLVHSKAGIEDIKTVDPYQLELSKSIECLPDINRICGTAASKSNFQVISCLQDGHRDFDISESCQHLIWVYKRNLTIDSKYEGAVKQVCSFMIQKVPECQDLPESRGHLIPCLIEYLDNFTTTGNDRCQSFLSRLKPVVFSDYRIIYKFSEACQNDIEALKCGRMDKGPSDPKGLMPIHQQGKVLTCLANEIKSVTKSCRRELLRVAELQADDYHNDRQLFLACRNDREKFCAQVESGEGRVYTCLFKHKMEPEMSQKCQDMLVLRQKLQQEDYRVNLGLSKACHSDILDHHCFRHIDRIASFSDARLSAVLLCLEDAMRDGKSVKPECRIELKEVRRSLMEDFAISPSLVVDCSKEIEQHCGGNLAREGRTIHCLMDLARPKVQSDKKEFVTEISPVCARSLENLLIEADVGEDYAVDPVLREACEPVARIYCSHIQIGDGRIMKCLLDSLDKPKMTDDCREGIMEIQYFFMRDFRLDTQLYKACKTDAVRLCQAPKKWYQPGDEKDMASEQGYLIFACLYKHIGRTSDEPNYEPLSRHCTAEVKRVMRERAWSVNLDPEVESQCLGDLSKFCLNKSDKDEEMMCLEANYKDLSPGCKEVIAEFISNADKNPSLNSIFLKACEPFWQEFCQGGDRRLTMDMIDEEFEKDLMGCLIDHKNHPSMDHKCRAGVEYHQIATLEDYKLSHKFRQACAPDFKKYCEPGKKEKWHVVVCLTNMVLNDTLLQKPHRVALECRKQLDFELLQRSESIALDPDLNKVCTADVKRFCSDVTDGKAAVIQCLTENMKNLTKKCHKEIFKRLELEALNPQTDYFLYTKCKSMIKKYCIDDLSSPHLLFSCLEKNKDEDKFDDKCKEAVLSRAHIFAQDIRLNRELSKFCYTDIIEFCKKEVDQLGDEEGDGKVVECLKRAFINRGKTKKLTEQCEVHVRRLIRMSAQDFRLDVALVGACEHEIASMCHEASESNRGSQTDRGDVEACLKEALATEKITREMNARCYVQVERLVEESIVDVQSDPKLFSLCSNDLNSFCSDVPRGDGRKLDCLLAKLVEHPDKLSDECARILKARSSLWKKVKPDLPENLKEVAHLVTSSPAVNYFLVVFVVFVSVVFVGGLCFGRFTKRIKRDMKNR